MTPLSDATAVSEVESTLPSPSWPSVFAPQHLTVRSAARRRVIPSPPIWRVARRDVGVCHLASVALTPLYFGSGSWPLRDNSVRLRAITTESSHPSRSRFEASSIACQNVTSVQSGRLLSEWCRQRYRNVRDGLALGVTAKLAVPNSVVTGLSSVLQRYLLRHRHQF